MLAANISMDQLAAAMSTFMDRPVANRTERPGFFAGLKLEWVPDQSQYAQYGPGVWARPMSDPSGPALSTALQEQLGLRLEPTKTSIEVIIVEMASRPTPN
jgi:uncharacterized protein (TIGR03435 family)